MARMNPPRRIDVHHHFLPQRYMREEQERIAGYKHGGMTADRLTSWTAAQAIEAMDDGCICVADAMGVKLSGFPGWFFTRTYHLFQLPLLSRKLRVVGRHRAAVADGDVKVAIRTEADRAAVVIPEWLFDPQ